MNLYYLHFNNYYNRIVKKFDTLAEYLTLPYYDNVLTASIAFNPNDGVDTKQVANVPVGNEFTYDYCVLADGNDIVSRWFILDANRNRNGQYTLTLRRDMFADSYEPVLDAPAFIEKATLESSDPMIFNSENMTFNQIKTSETLLKDETGCPWIVGYIATKNNEGQIYTYDTSFQPTYPVDLVDSNIDNFFNEIGVLRTQPTNKDGYFYGYFDQSIAQNNFGIIHESPNQFTTGQESTFNANFSHIGTVGINGQYPITYAQYSSFKNTILSDDVARKELCSLLAYEASNAFGYYTQSKVEELLNYREKILYTSDDNKYYKISVEYSSTAYTRRLVSQTNNPALFNVFNNYFGNGDSNSYIVNSNIPQYTFKLTDLSEHSYNINITADRYHLSDAPYDMFCIPYSDDLEIKKDGQTILTSSKQIALDAAMALSRKYAGQSQALYDVQLLPYCPVRYCIQEDGSFDISDNDVSYITKSGTDEKNGIILFASSDSFTFDIQLENPINISNYKIESECDMYRLCSPNYNGVFEFNAAKNYGVSSFNVDITYKPYNPYIHLNPNFKGLYGQDFNDSRGLVVGGDFSLPQATSSWESYQLNNKNFQASFDRQIENMEVNNAIQNMQAATQATLGTVGGVLGGFMAGGIGGAIMGGTASAVGGAIDYALQKAGQAEAIDYTRDQFGYSLGNIKAQATSLSKTSAIVYNNKLFPFLEYYTCTEQEKVALENKLKYNGMTVMRIGTIREFLKSEKSYIKGKIIRLENFNEDFHYVNELANEFNKGVFI